MEYALVLAVSALSLSALAALTAPRGSCCRLR
jgi:hypothetical protein